MGLDFSKLQGLNTAQEDINGPVRERSPNPKKDATSGGLKGLESIQEKNQKIKEVYHQQQENIRRAGQLRTEIIKGAADGEGVEVLFLKACECIGAMTGDKAFAELVRKRRQV